MTNQVSSHGDLAKQNLIEHKREKEWSRWDEKFSTPNFSRKEKRYD
jgi:hypothetical protein